MKRKILEILVIVTLHLANSIADPEVQLPNGLIRGREVVTLKNITYYAFEKIPYASPPVGRLRFKAPIPPLNWDEPLNTHYLNVSCYQQSANLEYETEDCLYINVFTPQLPTENINLSLPTIFFIHGGGFVGGTSRKVYSDVMVEKNIILVTLNYRLGPFGFLSTQDDVIPGNNGLKDQQFALQWTYDNINLFGGDPKQITILGQSAGSASCAYHLLSQKSRGLFRGAILQSGSFLSPWAFQRNARGIAFATAAFINSTFQSSNDSLLLKEFLMSVAAEELDTASEEYHKSQSSPKDKEILQGFYWAPVIEVKNPDAFLTKKMFGLLNAGNVAAVPIIIGMNSEESLSFNTHANVVESDMTAYDENLDWLIPNDMQITDEAQRLEMGQSIRDIYTSGEPLAEHLGDGIRYCSDTSFTRSIIKHAELFSQFNTTYFYQFSYDGVRGGLDVHYDGAESVGHTENNKYIFCTGSNCDLTGYAEMDQVTQERLIAMWTNFAKYQNPTPEPNELLQNVTWPSLYLNEGDFLFLDIGDNLEIKNHPRESSYTKWNDLYNSLEFNDFDTY